MIGQAVQLGDVAEFTMGQAPPGYSVNTEEKGMPFYRSGEFGARRPSLSAWTTNPLRISQPEDVWVCVVGANAGDINLGAHGAIGRSVAAISARDPLDHLYLYYFLRFRESWLRDQAAGSAQPVLSKDDLRRIEIPLPAVQTQRAIAATLGSLDDKIESNRRKSALAMDLALTIARREVTGSVSDRYQRAMTVHMGAAFKGEYFCEVGKGRPLLRIRDLKTFSPQTWTTEKRSDETIIEPGSVVVGMDAEFKATLWCGPRAILNQRVCQFRPLPGVSRAYLLVALAPQLRFYESAKTGTTVIHLNKADIETFEVPTLTEDQHLFLHSTTEPLIELVIKCAQENEVLEKLRDALLPELLSGRIRLGEDSK